MERIFFLLFLAAATKNVFSLVCVQSDCVSSDMSEINQCMKSFQLPNVTTCSNGIVCELYEKLYPDGTLERIATCNVHCKVSACLDHLPSYQCVRKCCYTDKCNAELLQSNGSLWMLSSALLSIISVITLLS
ncbi:hypothetical protein ACOME3_006618 [Neoechinorhynchus agilis]